MFSAPFPDDLVKSLLVYGMAGNILEDIPQLIIQSIALSGQLSTILLLSIIASVLTITFGLFKRLLIFFILRYGSQAKSRGSSAFLSLEKTDGEKPPIQIH